MEKHLFVHHGGGVPEAEEAQPQAIAAEGACSLVEVKGLDDALAKAAGCPSLADGDSLEVAETFEP
jgi:hypothetical protein